VSQHCTCGHPRESHRAFSGPCLISHFGDACECEEFYERSTVTPSDYNELARQSEQVREIVSALVAGLVHDGFTDREARTIVAGIFGSKIGEK
jgi:hypothetical protein